MFIYPPTITNYNILRTSYFTAYYEDSTSKVRGYSRMGRLSIRSEGQCSSVVPLNMQLLHCNGNSVYIFLFWE
jgi:hypothetical protein